MALPNFSIQRRWAIVICALFLLLFIPVWSVIIAPNLKKMPENFTYVADTLSLDNFYDENAKKFQGAHISKTSFSYRIVEKNPNYFKIENQFVVRTLSDKPIISVERIYFINPYTWQHIGIPGSEHRLGYLFGPRYANKKDFYYWHVNYNALAQLKFVAKEKIDGLTVNHYAAKYSADQTADLGHLPGVPDKRGVRAHINLQLWIEPISGWLVEVKDTTQSNYYDKKTGIEIAPWNKFSNSYTQNSVRQQIRIASLLKWKILFIDFGMPLLLLTLAVLLLCFEFILKEQVHLVMYSFRKTLKKINQSNLPYYVYISFIAVSIIASYIYYIYQQKSPVYVIGISQWNRNIDSLETIRGFKEGLAEYGFLEGRNLNFIMNNSESDINKQINIIQSFLDKKVNLIFTLTTPGTLIAKGISNKTPIIFSNVNYPEESELINSTNASKNNLVGIRNYISPAEQFNAFEKIFLNTKAIGFIYHKGDPDSEIQFKQFKTLLNDRNIAVIDIPAIDLDDLNRQLKRQDLNYNVLYLACDTLSQEGGAELVVNYSKQKKIPTFSCNKESIQKGILLGLVADPYMIGVLAGKKASLLLRGAEPTWLHTEAPKNGDLIINLKTAQSLGIAPTSSADHLVEGKK